MKKPLLACMTVAILLLAGSSAWALALLPSHGCLTMSETVSPGSDGWVEVDISYLTGIMDNPAVDQQAEFGSVMATLTGSDSSIGFLVLGTRYLQLLEPGSLDVVSDVVKLVANPVAYSDGRYTQTFSVSFYSSGLPDFATLLADSTGSPQVGLTGDLQDLSVATLLNTDSAFNLYVNSRSGEILEPSLTFCPIPLPGTLLLVGSGLLGLVGLGWRKRQR
jgi:hypothetical protein